MQNKNKKQEFLCFASVSTLYWGVGEAHIGYRTKRKRGHLKSGTVKVDNQGCWNRRIDDTNRLVYFIDGGQIYILQCITNYNEK